jgi:hypothetical protein
MAETPIRIVDHEEKLIAEEEETPLMTWSHAISKNKKFGSRILAPFRFSIAHLEIVVNAQTSISTFSGVTPKSILSPGQAPL